MSFLNPFQVGRINIEDFVTPFDVMNYYPSSGVAYRARHQRQPRSSFTKLLSQHFVSPIARFPTLNRPVQLVCTQTHIQGQINISWQPADHAKNLQDMLVSKSPEATCPGAARPEAALPASTRRRAKVQQRGAKVQQQDTQQQVHDTLKDTQQGLKYTQPDTQHKTTQHESPQQVERTVNPPQLEIPQDTMTPTTYDGISTDATSKPGSLAIPATVDLKLSAPTLRIPKGWEPYIISY